MPLAIVALLRAALARYHPLVCLGLAGATFALFFGLSFGLQAMGIAVSEYGDVGVPRRYVWGGVAALVVSVLLWVTLF